MDYSLAKELKDAGFPQLEQFPSIAPMARGVRVYSEDAAKTGLHTESNGAYAPTLEELIEACGDDFQGLFPPSVVGENIGWSAVKTIGEITPDGTFMKWHFYTGTTREEAVANLWLVLNKKS